MPATVTTNEARTFTPLHDHILIKMIEEQEARRGGIIIPDVAKDKPQMADVVAVGKGRILEKGNIVPLDVRAGDRVIIGKYAGTEVRLNGDDMVIIREDEVLGILPPKK